MMAEEVPTSFAYEAQTFAGEAISGTVDAPDTAAALQLLGGMGLRAIEVAPVARPARPRALGGKDFLAFNQQLAQLTAAGMPIEHGLRLIARDVRSKRLARTIELVTQEMESGRSLAEAFEAHRKQFPPLYGQLVDVGVKTGRLPGILLNLGRHLTLVHELRDALWQAAVYPVVVLVAMLGMMVFLSMYVIPSFWEIFEDFDIDLPMVTQHVFRFAENVPYVALGAGVLALICVVGYPIARTDAAAHRLLERIILALPLVGAAIRRNLVARWCDALYLGVDAGIDLPAALTLAGRAAGSPALQNDSRRLAEALEAGHSLSEATDRRILPATVPAAMDLAAAHRDLASTLLSLGQMYQQEAKIRINAVNVILPPILVVIVGLMLGFVIMALFLPLVHLITSLT